MLEGVSPLYCRKVSPEREGDRSVFEYTRNRLMTLDQVGIEEPAHFERFREVVLRQRFASFSREELCSVELSSQWSEDWNDLLVTAWERMIARFPTFILYFPGGTRFNPTSFRAFTVALKNLEDKEWSEGMGASISLFLGEQSLGDTGAEILAEAMNSYESLIHLNLKGNEIGGKGVQALARALKNNFTVKVLDLSQNPIDEAGVLALAEALKENCTLQTLVLSTDCVTVAAAKAFEAVRAVNTTLQDLDIWR